LTERRYRGEERREKGATMNLAGSSREREGGGERERWWATTTMARSRWTKAGGEIERARSRGGRPVGRSRGKVSSEMKRREN